MARRRRHRTLPSRPRSALPIDVQRALPPTLSPSQARSARPASIPYKEVFNAVVRSPTWGTHSLLTCGAIRYPLQGRSWEYCTNLFLDGRVPDAREYSNVECDPPDRPQPPSDPASRVALIAGLVLLVMKHQLSPSLGVPLMFGAAGISVLDMLRVLRELLAQVSGPRPKSVIPVSSRGF
jgi:hypothetical protein